MGRDWSLIALIATLIFVCLVFPSMLQSAGVAGTRQASYPLAGGFHWLEFGYTLWEVFIVSFAQICHFCAHRSPTLLPAKQPCPQDTFRQQDFVKGSHLFLTFALLLCVMVL